MIKPMLLSPLILILALGACDRLRGPGADPGWSEIPPPAVTPQARRAAGAVALSPLTGAAARPPAAFDRSTPAERAAALAAPVTGGALGQVVVALGNPAEPGFWLRSALVTAPRPGTAKLASGASVQVDLLPLSGGGAPQLSLAAYRALGLGLTDLPQVTVHGR